MLHPVCLPLVQLCISFVYVISQSWQHAYNLPCCILHSIPTTTLRHTAKAARQGGAEINQQASELTLSLAHTKLS